MSTSTFAEGSLWVVGRALRLSGLALQKSKKGRGVLSEPSHLSGKSILAERACGKQVGWLGLELGDRSWGDGRQMPPLPFTRAVASLPVQTFSATAYILFATQA